MRDAFIRTGCALARAGSPRMLECAGTLLGRGLATAGNSGTRQLARNLERLGIDADRALLRAAMASYMRYFARAFTLRADRPAAIDAAVRVVGEGASLVRDAQRGPTVLALPHAGNWDLAGAWAARHLGPLVTVAERVEPPALFAEFAALRRRLGMEIIFVAPGQRVFDQVVRACEGRTCVAALLADRDLSGRGIEVRLGSERALVAAGPAALAARLGAPLYPIVLTEERLGAAQASVAGTRYGIVLHALAPIRVGPGDIAAATQAWVSAIEPVLREHAPSWHMLQPLFVGDLDPARLARARARVEREETRP